MTVAQTFRNISGEAYDLPLPLEVIGYVPPSTKKLPAQGMAVTIYVVQRLTTGDKYFQVSPSGEVVQNAHITDRFDLLSLGANYQPIEQKLTGPSQQGWVDSNGKLSLVTKPAP
jgi:hypothetical protein